MWICSMDSGRVINPYGPALQAFFPGFELGGDGFWTGHAGCFAGREGTVEVEDFGPIVFEGEVDF